MKLDFSDLEFIKEHDYVIIKRQNKYFRIGNKESQMIQDLSISSKEDFLKKYSMNESQFEEFTDLLNNIGIIGEKKKERKNFLFYKIPLINPDVFLGKIVDSCFRNKHVNIVLMVTLMTIIFYGIVLSIYNFNDMLSLFLKDLTIKDFIILYALSILVVFIHEIGHALFCKFFGGEVKEIGFLLLFFSPAFYCDVSGLRFFDKKYKKILTLLAGIFVQILVYSIMSIIFDIGYNSSLIATFTLWNFIMIFSNIIPIIKLDGYWILSIAINVPNLYEKSLKLALGVSDENILFNTYEMKLKKFIKIYGQLTLLGVLLMIGMGIHSIAYINNSINDSFKYILIIIELIIYLLMLGLFIKFLFQLKRNKVKG